MADEQRFCVYCDQKVRQIKPEEKQWGKGVTPGGYVHMASSEGGIPGCGRQFLAEDFTYTEEDLARESS